MSETGQCARGGGDCPNGGSAAPVRAKDVEVRKLFRAACYRPGCGWQGTERGTYQDANAERQAHLAQHARELVTGSAP